MTRYRGTQMVGPGYYFNVREMAFHSMEDEGRLPGSREDEYRRVPAAALLVAGPLMGLVYVMFLPVIGFAMLAWVAGGKAVGLLTQAAVSVGRVLTPVWKPAMAFFSKGRPAKSPNKRADAWAKDVRKELEEETDERE